MTSSIYEFSSFATTSWMVHTRY